MADTAAERSGLVSLFCGAGGLDLGFEEAGFEVLAAFDVRPDAVDSYNHNRTQAAKVAHVRDVSTLTPEGLDALLGRRIAPIGVIGGPPCQSFSRATHSSDDDPRHDLPLRYAELLKSLNARHPVDFFVLENVPGLLKERHATRLANIIAALDDAGFHVFQAQMNASDFGVAQNRPRLIIVGLNKALGEISWAAPRDQSPQRKTVKDAIGHLAEPAYWSRGLDRSTIPEHPNHWCMTPKSKSFTTPGALVPGTARGRSFRTLAWGDLSPTVAYGHREVHVHPNCNRRLSVHEALLLQGFPREFELLGSLSSQITQVSEAVPPPLAKGIAHSLRGLLYGDDQIGKAVGDTGHAIVTEGSKD